MRNWGRHQDRQSHRHRRRRLGPSPSPGPYTRFDGEAPETVALRGLLPRRRDGAFVDGEGMDARLDRMTADMRRAHGRQS